MMPKNRSVFGTSALLGAVLAAGMVSAPLATVRAEGQDGGPVVKTVEGPVRGLVNNGVYEFKGIPYAAPPTGELRWRPPQPVAHWQEPLDATSFANTCPQVTTLAVFASPASITETACISTSSRPGLAAADSRSSSGSTAAAMLMVNPMTTTGANLRRAGRVEHPLWSSRSTIA